MPAETDRPTRMILVPVRDVNAYCHESQLDDLVVAQTYKQARAVATAKNTRVNARLNADGDLRERPSAWALAYVPYAYPKVI